MGLISQLVSVGIGNFIKASEWNNEFLQIINLLNGTSSTKEVKIVSSAPGASLATLTADRGDTGSIARFTKGGALKAAVNSEGPSISNSTDIVTVGFLQSIKIPWVHATFFGGEPTVGDRTTQWFAPTTDGSYFVNKIAGTFEDTSGGGNGDTTFKLKKVLAAGGAPTDVATITFNRPADAAEVTKEVDISPAVALAENDHLYMECTANAPTGRRKYSISISGYSKSIV